jgi:hypothetical protein
VESAAPSCQSNNRRDGLGIYWRKGGTAPPLSLMGSLLTEVVSGTLSAHRTPVNPSEYIGGRFTSAHWGVPLWVEVWTYLEAFYKGRDLQWSNLFRI